MFNSIVLQELFLVYLYISIPIHVKIQKNQRKYTSVTHEANLSALQAF